MIKNGDIVTLHFKGSSVENVKVLNMPRGEGDLLQLEFEGEVIAINPYSPHFKQLALQIKRRVNHEDRDRN